MNDIKGFEKYLVGRGYRDATVSTYLRVIQSALKNGDITKKLLNRKLPTGSRTTLSAALKHWADFVGGGTGKEIKKKLGSLPRYRPHSEAPERPLTDNEWKGLMGALEGEEEPLRQILSLLCRTGLRVGSDIGQIERSRVREALETGTLWLQTKGGHYRPYPAKAIAPELEALLEWEKWDRLWQCGGNPTKSAYYMKVRRGLRRCAERAGMDPKKVHAHLLRKTTATQLLKTTGNIVAVQKMLGHKNIQTTQIYLAYADPEELEEIMSSLEESREKG